MRNRHEQTLDHSLSGCLLTASAMATSARESTPSLMSIWLTWNSTVLTLIYSSVAMSRLDFPLATARATINWRGVSGGWEASGSDRAS